MSFLTGLAGFRGFFFAAAGLGFFDGVFVGVFGIGLALSADPSDSLAQGSISAGDSIVSSGAL